MLHVGHAELVTMLLLKRGANINARNHLSKTPLLLAVENGFEEIAEFLIKKGANINVSDSKGNTALHLAARNCNKYS